MGNSASAPKNEQIIMDEMALYAGKWNSRSTLATQTDLFRKIVPTEEADFSEAFLENQLDGIFTSNKVVLGDGSYNSNFLFRDSRKVTKFPVFSDSNFTALHPLGEPGLALGQGNGSKVSHLMIIKHSEDGPITFNEMLPSTSDEVEDLGARLAFAKQAVLAMKNNVPLSQCGSKVQTKAGDQGIDPSTGIRDYLAHMISHMPEDERNGRPGYKLFNKDDVRCDEDEIQVKALLNDVYGNEDMNPYITIQPPSQNSQLLSHLHCFMLDSVPECMNELYYDCEVILKIKQDHMELLDQSEEEDDGSALSRTTTVRAGGE